MERRDGMIEVRDCVTQRENATVAGIMFQLNKHEERKQRFRWIAGMTCLALSVLVLLMVVIH